MEQPKTRIPFVIVNTRRWETQIPWLTIRNYMKLIERAAYLTLESVQIPREINLPVENKVTDGFYLKYFITIWHVRLIHHGCLDLTF